MALKFVFTKPGVFLLHIWQQYFYAHGVSADANETRLTWIPNKMVFFHCSPCSANSLTDFIDRWRRLILFICKFSSHLQYERIYVWERFLLSYRRTCSLRRLICIFALCGGSEEKLFRKWIGYGIIEGEVLILFATTAAVIFYCAITASV